MRHLGWLHATPEGAKKSRLTSFREQDVDHPFIRMPDIETEYSAGYLIGLLFEAGLMSSNGMGPVPISWLEIDAWLRVTETELSLWERIKIKQLSEEYVTELALATDKNRPQPYVYLPPVEVIDRDAVADKIRSFIAGFKKRSGAALS